MLHFIHNSKSKLLSVFVLVALLSFPFSAAFAEEAPPSGGITLNGSGTVYAPYEINSCEQLAQVNLAPSASFRLVDHLYCDGVTDFQPIDNFTGELFDGGLLNIYDLHVNSTEGDAVGLFRHIGENSTVQNLSFVSDAYDGSGASLDVSSSNPNNLATGYVAGINDGTITNVKIGEYYSTNTLLTLKSSGTLGSIAGINNGTISRVSVASSIQLVEGANIVGGIVGVNNGTIEDVATRTTINSEALSPAVTEATCGGIAGEQHDGTIERAFVTGRLRCVGLTNNTGGLVGITTGTSQITDSFHDLTTQWTGFNTSSPLKGAIAGTNPDSIDLSSNYYWNSTSINCDDTGNNTCVYESNRSAFYDPAHIVYTNWGLTDSMPVFSTPYTSGYGYYWPEYYWYNYLPQLNQSYAAKPYAPEIVSKSATETTASFTWIARNFCGGCSSSIPTEFDIYQGIVPDFNGEGSVNVEYTQIATHPVSGWGGDNQSYVVTGLDPNVFYDFLIVPRSTAGEGPPSESIEIRKIPTQLNKPEAISVKSGVVTLQWNDASQTAERYTVEYKKSSDTEWLRRGSTNYPSPNASVYPLDASTSYDFRVTSSNIRGTSPASEVLTLTTTEQNLYNIDSCEDLQNINDDPYGYYSVTQDIDCSGSEEWNDGEGFLPIGITEELLESMDSGTDLNNLIPFSGTLEGNEHSISNLGVNVRGALGGLFASIDGATISNLTLQSGRVVGSAADPFTVFTDAPTTLVVGGLAAIAANSTITNVTNNINIYSDLDHGNVAFSGGLIGIVLPSALGPNADETLLTISDSHANAQTAGFISSAGLIGATIPVDVFTLVLEGLEGETSSDPDHYISKLGTRLEVSINDSTANGTLGCGIVCSGFVGVNAGDLTLTNVSRDATTGSFDVPMTDGVDSLFNIIEMFGPITSGAIGVNFPISLNETPSTLTMTDVTIDGEISGIATAGIIGLSLPAIAVDLELFLDTFDYVSSSSDEPDFSTFIPDFIESVSIYSAFDITNTTINATNNCYVVCTGASLMNFASGTYDHVNINGDIQNQEFDNPSETFGETLAMIAQYGPITTGFVGLNFPISTSQSSSGLTISNSVVQSDLSGTAATGLVTFSLPGLNIDKSILSDTLVPFFDAISEDAWQRYSDLYGSDWYYDQELYEQYEDEQNQILTNGTSTLAGLIAYVPANSSAVNVVNTDIEGDIRCSVVCSGGVGISLARLVFDQFTVNGNITNDNEAILFESSPLEYCPAQITGGVVGTQLLLPVSVSNSDINGNITVNQTGTIPDKSIASTIDDFISPDDGEEPFSMESIIDLSCGAGNALITGTGGVAGSFISPFEISQAVDQTLGHEVAPSVPWEISISNTNNKGDIETNSPTATGGLVGLSIGQSHIATSTNEGTITNSTFAEMFRTPISSAATGGLVGHSIGSLGFSGDMSEFTLDIFEIIDTEEIIEKIFELDTIGIHTTGVTIEGSSSTGDINTSNTAGGLIGTASNDAHIYKSFSTGDVYGVTAGGLIGSGFNMGSPFGIFDMFSSVVLENTYARGNIVASDADNTFTFAGGLVGFMTHFGEFKINNSYSTGGISVRNDATDTRLVAGGFVGAELDMSFVTQFVESAIAFSEDLDLGSEELNSYVDMVSQYGNGGLDLLTQLGIPFKKGFNVTNSFTTSAVPPTTGSERDRLLQEIITGLPEERTTSGSMFGFAFSIDKQEIDDLLQNALSTYQNIEPEDLEGSDIFATGLAEDVMDTIREFNWMSPGELAPNSFYDISQSDAGRCTSSLPSTDDLILYMLPKLTTLVSGGDSLDVFSLIPYIDTLEGTQCAGVNESGEQSQHFKNNKTVAPLTSWNFTDIWHVQSDDYPTFVAQPTANPDPGADPDVDSDPPPGTGTDNNNNGGTNSFVPNPVTPTQVQKLLDKVKVAPNVKTLLKDATEVLGQTANKLEDEAKKQEEGDSSDDGLVNTITGMFSATGMFLFRNLITVLALLSTGFTLWYFTRKNKKLKTAEK